MRGWLAILVLAAAVHAAPADPLAPTQEQLGGVTPEAYCRVVETLALIKETLQKDPANVRALDRAMTLLQRFNLDLQLQEHVKRGLAAGDLTDPQRARLNGLRARLLVREAIGTGGIVWVFVNGRIQREELSLEQRGKLTLAVELLRDALRADPRAGAEREALANALERLDQEKNANEVRKLRAEAAVLRPRPGPRGAVRLDQEANKVRAQAVELETKEPPDHAGALLLRRKALVLDFATHTIPFEYDAAIYGPVSLLAPQHVVQENLTRCFRQTNGEIGRVPPVYYPAPPAKRLKILEGLAQDRSAAAGAVLLKMLLEAAPSAETDAARASLARGRHEAVLKQLPPLLATALFSADTRHFPDHGQAQLVHLAADLDVKEAVPVLGAALPLERDLFWPRDIAAALGRLGGTAAVDSLLKIAADPERDVYFRRQAIVALGRLQPDRLAEVPNEPFLEIAIAAARYASNPSDEARGRILAGLGREHEADDAARYCAEFQIREAIPALEEFAATKKEHYARKAVGAALHTLTGRS